MIDKIKMSKFVISKNNTKTTCKIIEKINNKYSKLDVNNLRFDNKTITSNMIMKAAEYDCFLGFDTKFLWIDYINKELKEKFNKRNKKNIQKII